MFTIIPHAQQMLKNEEKHILHKHYRAIHQDFSTFSFLYKTKPWSKLGTTNTGSDVNRAEANSTEKIT